MAVGVKPWYSIRTEILIAYFLLIALVLTLILILLFPRKHNAVLDSIECYEDSNGTDYRGLVNITLRGRHCAAWNSDNHPMTRQNHPDAGIGDHNYCRNPDGDVTVWCYITDETALWEYCFIGEPSDDCGIMTDTKSTITIGYLESTDLRKKTVSKTNGII
uniref:Apolipoprotein(A)-like n=1 Tax=Saccoglossus kowalevskii TaxID=10224 RepID=A0ABM0M5U7_SACKO|nr:PREDICTED: apolipoprotein(a)-like [Saccoglossus kowalevskii]